MNLNTSNGASINYVTWLDFRVLLFITPVSWTLIHSLRIYEKTFPLICPRGLWIPPKFYDEEDRIFVQKRSEIAWGENY